MSTGIVSVASSERERERNIEKTAAGKKRNGKREAQVFYYDLRLRPCNPGLNCRFRFFSSPPFDE